MEWWNDLQLHSPKGGTRLRHGQTRLVIVIVSFRVRHVDPQSQFATVVGQKSEGDEPPQGAEQLENQNDDDGFEFRREAGDQERRQREIDDCPGKLAALCEHVELVGGRPSQRTANQANPKPG